MALMPAIVALPHGAGKVFQQAAVWAAVARLAPAGVRP